MIMPTLLRRAVASALALGLACTAALAQPPAAPKEPPRPAPRHADGRINFGPPDGEVGFWVRR
ncbi:MAG: hypothetical protein RLZZ169_1608, partial [Pseudomonadota bacterium]